MRLIGLLGADAARLAEELTAIPRGLPPDDTYSYATSARHLATAMARSTGRLTALGIEKQFELGKAIKYTQALGQAETALHTAQELTSALDTSTCVANDLRALSEAAGQITSAVAELDRLVGPHP